MFAFRSLSRVTILPLAVLALAAAPAAFAAENPHATENKAVGSAHGKSQVERGRSSFKADLRTAQHVYYPGDALNLSVKFARGAELLASNAADAFIVIYSKDGTAFSAPVPDDIGADNRRFFPIDKIDTTTLPEGQYQLGLVVTTPGGDPLKLTDWYSGFRGLLDVEAILITATPIANDKNHDGELDSDDDHDGLEEAEDESGK